MNPGIRDIAAASSAEEIFEHLGVDFDRALVNVCRLHILKRFRQYLSREDWMEGLEPQAARTRAAVLLARAHADFAASSPRAEKVFKVFEGARQTIPLQALRGRRARSLPGSASGPGELS